MGGFSLCAGFCAASREFARLIWRVNRRGEFVRCLYFFLFCWAIVFFYLCFIFLLFFMASHVVLMSLIERMIMENLRYSLCENENYTRNLYNFYDMMCLW